jgi:hypothetical protein
MVGIPPFFIELRKGKYEKDIQLEGGNKIRSQSCKIGRQTCTRKMKNSFFNLEEIWNVINNYWTIHLKNKESN